MNRLLILGGRVVDPAAELNRRMELTVEAGHISMILPPSSRLAKARPGDRVVDASGMLVLPGLIDLHVHLREPGMVEAEDLKSGTRAAAAGGFTTVVCMPNTQPVLDRPVRLRRLLGKKNHKSAARVLVAAALSKNLNGREVTDVESLAQEGACALSDDGLGTGSAVVLQEALARAAAVDKPVFLHCEDHSLSRNGVMHQGPVAQRLGLAGIPAQAEHQAIQTALRLNRRPKARLHIQHVSTDSALKLVRRAKRTGLPVTAEVTPHHLFLQVEDVERSKGRFGPNPNLKMNPPLRTERDRLALQQALCDGSLDAIASDHAPHTRASKACGFSRAPFGVTGLETSLPLVLRLVEQGILGLDRAVALLTTGPAKVLGMDIGTLRPGTVADVIVVDPKRTWRVVPSRMRSRSSNTAFAGWVMKGKVVWTIVAGRIIHRAGNTG